MKAQHPIEFRRLITWTSSLANIHRYFYLSNYILTNDKQLSQIKTRYFHEIVFIIIILIQKIQIQQTNIVYQSQTHQNCLAYSKISVKEASKLYFSSKKQPKYIFTKTYYQTFIILIMLQNTQEYPFSKKAYLGGIDHIGSKCPSTSFKSVPSFSTKPDMICSINFISEDDHRIQENQPHMHLLTNFVNILKNYLLSLKLAFPDASLQNQDYLKDFQDSNIQKIIELLVFKLNIVCKTVLQKQEKDNLEHNLLLKLQQQFQIRKQSFQNENSQLNKKLQFLSQKIKENQKQLLLLKNDKNIDIETTQRLVTEKENLKHELGNLQLDLKKKQLCIDAKEKQIEHLKNVIASSDQKYKLQLAAVSLQLTTSQIDRQSHQRLSDVQQLLASNKQQTKQIIESYRKQIEKIINQHHQVKTNLNAKISTFQQQIDELSQRNFIRQNEIKKLKQYSSKHQEQASHRAQYERHLEKQSIMKSNQIIKLSSLIENLKNQNQKLLRPNEQNNRLKIHSKIIQQKFDLLSKFQLYQAQTQTEQNYLQNNHENIIGFEQKILDCQKSNRLLLNQNQRLTDIRRQLYEKLKTVEDEYTKFKKEYSNSKPKLSNIPEEGTLITSQITLIDRNDVLRSFETKIQTLKEIMLSLDSEKSYEKLNQPSIDNRCEKHPQIQEIVLPFPVQQDRKQAQQQIHPIYQQSSQHQNQCMKRTNMHTKYLIRSPIDGVYETKHPFCISPQKSLRIGLNYNVAPFRYGDSNNVRYCQIPQMKSIEPQIKRIVPSHLRM